MFDRLPQHIIIFIFSFDSTYKCVFSKEILQKQEKYGFYLNVYLPFKHPNIYGAVLSMICQEYDIPPALHLVKYCMYSTRKITIESYIYNDVSWEASTERLYFLNIEGVSLKQLVVQILKYWRKNNKTIYVELDSVFDSLIYIENDSTINTLDLENQKRVYIYGLETFIMISIKMWKQNNCLIHVNFIPGFLWSEIFLKLLMADLSVCCFTANT